MKGSEKQIKWAEEIREKMLAKLKQKMSANTLPPEFPDRDNIFQLMCRQYGQAVFLPKRPMKQYGLLKTRRLWIALKLFVVPLKSSKTIYGKVEICTDFYCHTGK